MGTMEHLEPFNRADVRCSRIAPPALAPHLVERPALDALLDALCDWKLTIVWAPAGFGKRTALARWALRRAGDEGGIRMTWMRVSEGDVDADGAVSFDPSPAGEACDVEEEVIVVTGFEALDGADGARRLAQACLSSPPGRCAVLVSSCEPRYDELGIIPGMDCHVVEVRDFLFDEAEIDDVYDSLGVPAAERRTREMAGDCGGWPFFVFAEAAARRGGATARRRRQQRDAFFAGVMRSLGGGLRGFVEATCFLDALAPDLCDEVAGVRGSASMLEGLRRRGLASEAGRGMWELYPPLRRHLVAALPDGRPVELRKANRVAYGWYAARGMHLEAARQVVLATDMADPLSVTRDLLPAGMRLDEGLVAKLASDPLDALAASPNSCIAIALAYLFAGNGAEALFWTDKLRDACAGMEDEGRSQVFLSMAPFLEQKARAHLGQAAESIGIGESLLADGRGTLGPVAEALVLQTLGEACEQVGCIADARERYDRAAVLGSVEPNPTLLAYIQYDSIWLSYRCGHVRAAARLCGEALASCPRHLPIHAGLRYFDALLRVEAGEAPDIAALDADAGPMVSPLNNPDLFMDAHVARARCSMLAGDEEAAYRSVSRGLAELAGLAVPRGVLASATGELVQLALCVGAAAQADAARTRLAALAGAEGSIAALYLLLADVRIALARGEGKLASELAGKLHARASGLGLGRFALNALVVRACSAYARGDAAAGDRALADALACGADGGVYAYLPHRRALQAPLFALASSRRLNYASLAHARRVLLAFERAGASAAPDGGSPLSAKEREVLVLLALGYSRDEMARALVVSVNTVKTHLSHVYAKLGAHTRAEAVAEARRLGLV